MAFDFPSSPAIGQIYSSGGVSYVWNGYGWTKQATADSASKSYVDTQDALRVAKAGDTMSGDLTIQKDSPTLILNSPGAAANNQILGYRTSTLRWKTQFGNLQSETGADAGSDFEITRYSDGGSLNSALYLKRSNGNVGFGTTTPGYINIAGVHCVTNYALSSYSVFEAATGQADGDGVAAGAYTFMAPNSVSGTNKNAGGMYGYTSGATAGNRGGKLVFFTKADGGGLQQALELRANQFAYFGAAIGVQGTVYFNPAFTAYLNFNGSQFLSTHNLILSSSVLYFSDTSRYLQWQGAGGYLVVNGMPLYVGNNFYATGTGRFDNYVQINPGNANLGSTQLSIGSGTNWAPSGIGVRWWSTSSWTGITFQENNSGGTGIYEMFLRDDGAQLGYIAGNVGSIIYSTTSDERLKENIRMAREVVNPKAMIRALKPRHFKWKGYDKSEVGLIAQEVVDVIKDVTLPPVTQTYTDDNGNEQTRTSSWMINYPGLTPYMIDAMQVMMDEIDELKTKIAA